MICAFVSGLLVGGASVAAALYAIPALFELRRSRPAVVIDHVELRARRRAKVELAESRRRQRIPVAR